MSKDEKKSRSGGSGVATAAILIGLLIVLPMLYFLSIGPVVWYCLTHNISTGGFVDTYYYPWEWLYDHCKPLQPFMDWYMEPWMV